MKTTIFVHAIKFRQYRADSTFLREDKCPCCITTKGNKESKMIDSKVLKNTNVLQTFIIFLLIVVLNQLSTISQLPISDEHETDIVALEDGKTYQLNNGPKDRCTADEDVCLYNNICYNIEVDKWETSSEVKGKPLLNNIGMNNKHEIPVGHELYAHSQCNERLQVSQSAYEKIREDKVHFVNGTTYHVCCWINHLGHSLMNMVIPAFHALNKIGMKNELSSMKFLLESRIEEKLAAPLNLFAFATGDYEKVSILSQLKQEAKESHKSHICFEKFVVGMSKDALIGVGIGDTGGVEKVEVGMLQPLKDHLDTLYPVNQKSISAALQSTLLSSPTQPTSPPDCTVTLLERKNAKRGIMNDAETIQTIKEVFDPTKWNFQRVSFESDSSTFLSQYMSMKSTMLQISVSGTGSHLSMFLPDGGIDLEIKFLARNHNNNILCGILPNLHCLSVDPVDVFGDNKKLAKESDVLVDLVELKKALQQAHEQLSTRCRIASTN